VRKAAIGPAVLALAIACAPGDAAPGAASSALVPELEGWGGGEPIPSDPALFEELVAALELRQRHEFAVVLDARDPGELHEEARLTQEALDRGIFGLDALFVVGDELFDLAIRPEQGLGNALAGRPGIPAGELPPPNLRRVHAGEFGGPDAHRCAACHSLGGLDGAGTSTQNAFFRGDGDSTAGADERSAPHLLGLGPIEALAREMTRELAAIREAASAEALATASPIERALEAHGVSFGVIRARADGTIDASGVLGVDRDLIIRPFGWKGHGASIRAMALEAFRVHAGVVSVAAQARVAAGELPTTVYGDGPAEDVDRDGVALEIEDGMITTMVAYLAQLEIPEVRPPREEVMLDLFARGSEVFDDIGCAECHRRALVLVDPILETRPDLPALADRAPVRIDVARDGEAPRIAPRDSAGTSFDVPLFADLRRHDMGPELATPGPQGGIPASVFLTRPLWGLADTAPYLHDGRAPTIEDAILAHGGEAGPARDAFAMLGEGERAALRVFLASFSRTPRIRIP
jgi:mono/diheme cytochrome c family protein